MRKLKNSNEYTHIGNEFQAILPLEFQIGTMTPTILESVRFKCFNKLLKQMLSIPLTVLQCFPFPFRLFPSSSTIVL